MKSEANNGFVFDAEVGDDCVYYEDTSKTRSCLAKILRVKTGSNANLADVVLYLPNCQERMRLNCLHVDDPRVKERPDILRDRGCGCFELSPATLRLKAAQKRLDEVEKEAQRATALVAEMRKDVESLLRKAAKAEARQA